MKDSLVSFSFWVMVLLLAAAAEETLPHILGVGFPVLMATVLVQAKGKDRPLLSTLLFVLAAGALEDALSSLPAMTSASAFLLLALFVRCTGMPWAAAVFAYPCYELWLEVWTGGLGGGIFNRLLLALPIGFATSFAADAVIGWAGRKAAVDEHG